MANVGVIAGVDVPIGDGVFDGNTVGADVDVSNGETSLVSVATVGAEGSKTSVGVQEANIQIKQRRIVTRLSMANSS